MQDVDLSHLYASRDLSLEELNKKKSIASRGKSAEATVSAVLSEIARQKRFAFDRLADARAGSRTAAIADFLCTLDGKMIFIEVKEVEHAYRLPHKNFDKDQVARMRRFKMAGATAIVVVHFKTIKLWRGADIDYFRERIGGSWDMRDVLPQPLEHWLSL